MEKNCSVPLPVNFNCWKHHARFIKGKIESITKINQLDELKKHLLQIGESQMDLYYGSYLPVGVSEHIISSLKQNKICSSEEYKEWLKNDGKDYQLLKLKDKSVWTLRLGDDLKRYVHIHPGRYSPHTIRIKAITLKTAILILCFEQIGERKNVDTELVNRIRKKYLNEPPIKSFSIASGLGKIIVLLSKKL